jgi:predicted transcriptional regulator
LPDTYGLKENLDTIRKLRKGEALIVNYDHFRDGIRTFIRPPLSAVREVSDEEIRMINGTQETLEKVIKSKIQTGDKEAEILELVKTHWDEHHDVIFADEIQRQLKLSTGARQRILDRMVKKGQIKKVSVNIGQGRPRTGIKPLV